MRAHWFVALLALDVAPVFAAQCTTGLVPRPKKKLHCEQTGIVVRPKLLSTSALGSFTTCRDSCLGTKSCISFGFSDSTSLCMLYSATLNSQGFRETPAGIEVANRHCYGCLCPAGQKTCGKSTECVDLLSDKSNCGKCGHICPGGAATACSSGGCVCQNPAKSLCGSACFNLDNDPKHCGSCGRGCEVTDSICDSGDCVYPNSIPDTCDGQCVNTLQDDKYCGSCDNSCASETQTCSDGACVCQDTSLTNCNGTCLDLNNDADNCGKCGTVCTSGQCSGGECSTPGVSFRAVIPGYEGPEEFLSTDTGSTYSYISILPKDTPPYAPTQLSLDPDTGRLTRADNSDVYVGMFRDNNGVAELVTIAYADAEPYRPYGYYHPLSCQIAPDNGRLTCSVVDAEFTGETLNGFWINSKNELIVLNDDQASMASDNGYTEAQLFVGPSG